MNISGILKKSLASALLAAGFSLAAASSIFTADQVELIPDRVGSDANDTVEELKMLDRQLCALLRVGNRRSPILCRIAFSDKVPEGEVLLKSAKNIWTIEFNDRTPEWQRSFSMRGRILGWLLAAKLNNRSLAAWPERFPAWVVAGIDARIEGSRTAERFLRRNRQLPLLRALLACGKFPDFQQTMQMNPAELSESGLVWYRELCRVLVDSASTSSTPVDNAFLDYLVLTAAGTAEPEHVFRSTLGRLWLSAAERSPLPGKLETEGWKELGADAKIQRYLEYSAEQLAWHEFSPRPAELTQKQLDEILQADLPELDANGEPTGRRLRVDYAELPELVIQRPDAYQLLRDESLRLRSIVEGNGLDFSRLLRDLDLKLLALPITRVEPHDPAPAEEFRHALRTLRESVERRAGIERYLEEFERSAESPFRLYESRIREASRPDDFLIERARKFLERTEALYLQE
ncbi:hypothetical protein [Victivallis vadensis]|uniref:hypothetical protein n=1 Tax=Victivallis vadensis TaxID=172901 RepID=UPI003D01374C